LALTAFARFALASFSIIDLPIFFRFGFGFRFCYFLGFGLPSFSAFHDRPLAAFALYAFNGLRCLPLQLCLCLLGRVWIGVLFGFCFGFDFFLHIQCPFMLPSSPSGIFLGLLSAGNFLIPPSFLASDSFFACAAIHVRSLAAGL
jgi:hypothetical protein